jgi:hypothetical protein
MLQKIDVCSSEWCEDAPEAILIDTEQFRGLIGGVSRRLKDIGFDYAVRWYQGADFTALGWDGELIPEDDFPYGYHQHLKVYADGGAKLLWENKHGPRCKFWIDF